MKKIVLFIIAFLIIPNISFAYTDVEGTEYENAVTILTGLSIMGAVEKDKFFPDEIATREYATVTILKMIGAYELSLSYSGANYYTDIETSKYRAQINFATDIGLFSGVSKNVFAPDEAITVEQFLRVVIDALGYREAALSRGGYPSGYLMTASGLKLLPKSSMGNLKRGVMAQICLQALNTKMAYSDKDSHYTLMNDKLSIYKGTGIVTQNIYTSLSYGRGTNRKTVVINSETFLDGTSGASDLLGYNVEYYYRFNKNDADNNEIIFIKTKNNKEMSLSSNDIISISSEHVKYEDESKTYNVKFSRNADYIYNGKARFDFPDHMSYYTLKLIDNDSDGSYDVIFINEYEIYEVSGVDFDKIYDKNAKETIEVDDDTVFYKDNVRADYSDISVGNILLICTAEELTTIYISDEFINGTVTEISDMSINLDNKSFELTKSLESYIQSGYTKHPLVGDVVNAYFDYFGTLIKFEISGSKSEKYGYVINSNKQSGLNDTYEFKIVVHSFEAKVYNTARNWKLNNVKVTGDVVIEPQLVKFELNADEEIFSIITAERNVSNPQFDSSILSLDAETAAGGTMYFNKSGRVIENYFLNKDTPIFCVPLLGAGEMLDDAVDRFKVTGYNDVTSNDYTNVKIYDVTEYKTVGALTLTVTTSIPIFKGSVKHMVIDKFTNSVDKEGVPIKRVYGYVDGVLISKDVSNDIDRNFAESQYSGITLADFKKGDIIQYFTNDKDVINYLKPMYVGEKISLGSIYEYGGERGNREFKTEFNVLYKAKHDLILLGTTFDTARVYSTDSARVYIYDEKAQKIHISTPQSLTATDMHTSKVFVYANWEQAVTILLVK